MTVTMQLPWRAAAETRQSCPLHRM